MVWQYHEAKRQIELERQKQALRKAAEDLAAANVVMNDQLRALDNAAVGLVVGVRTLSIGMRRVKMREKWGGKSVEEMDAAERASAAAAVGLEAANARGEKLAEWCWQEDDHKIAKYDPNTVRAPNWILYSDLIAAQLEERWQADKAAIVEIDINGKVRSATGGKAYAAETGTQYTVDFNKMTQKNMKSGFSRKIRREAISADVGGSGDVEPGFMGGLFRATSKSMGIELDEVKVPDVNDGTPTVPAVELRAIGDDGGGMPEFPADLMNPGPGLEPEPILLIKVGMLVQVQDKRDDGWWYGFALEADTDDDAGAGQDRPWSAAEDAALAAAARAAWPWADVAAAVAAAAADGAAARAPEQCRQRWSAAAPEVPLKDMAEALKRDLHCDAAGRQLYTVSSTSAIVESACRKYNVDARGSLKDRAKAAYDAMRDVASQDLNNA